MDIRISRNGLNFEWDDNKNTLNILNHKIPFSIALEVFFDQNAIIRYDDIHSIEEERFQIIGKVQKILVVAYTEREGNSIRLISARLAEKEEEEAYYGNIR